MKIGTKSVLFGAHAFWLHPFLVAWAWYKLYKFRWVEYGRQDMARWEKEPLVTALQVNPDLRVNVSRMTSLWDFRLWVSFFVHDIGYVGKENMDGPEGETHPWLGGSWMVRLFGQLWGDFTVYHSGYYARHNHAVPSALYYADKLAFTLEWSWFYVLRTRLTGEIKEYRTVDKHRQATHSYISEETRQDTSWRGDLEWFARISEYHRDLARPARERIFVAH